MDLWLGEQAKDIEGYEGLYAVTTFGRIWAYPVEGRKGKWLRFTRIHTNYVQVGLNRGGEKRKWFYLHRLVAIAFLPNPEHKKQVNHINGVRYDCRLQNLEWVTSMENHTHAFEHGLHPRRKIHPSKKQEVYDLVKSGVPIKDVAAKYGLKPGGVWSLVYRYKEQQELRQAA